MDKNQNQSERLDMRLSPSEKEAFRLAAECTGLSLSSWIRQRLRRAAASDLTEAGKKVPFMAPRPQAG